MIIEALSGPLQIGLATAAGAFALLVGGGAIYATLDGDDRSKVRTLARHPLQTIFAEDEPGIDD
ncbi:MAG TPA: hypothetical protein VFT50_05490 [Baekduia sp.]|nr:hypothetical protein [Baekduia sp.]